VDSGGIIKRLVKKYYAPMVVKYATDLFSCSKAAADFLYKDHSDGTIVIKNGIDCASFMFCSGAREKLRQSLEIADDQVVFFNAARFSKQKNHPFLIRIFSSALKELREIYRIEQLPILLLAGDGETKTAAERLVDEYAIQDNVRFLGLRRDIAELLSSADVYIMPSLYEGLPVSLVEAQTSGLSCIVSTGVPEEVDIVKGLVQHFSLDDTATWVHAITTRVSSFDEAITNNRKNAASIVAENGYDIKTTAEWLQNFYLEKAYSLESGSN
jgi:glycosyltransferase involved in cell wall biosynthesis